MPVYITQGRYTRAAIKGMLIKPEDRALEISRLLGKVGGKLIGGECGDLLCAQTQATGTQAIEKLAYDDHIRAPSTRPAHAANLPISSDRSAPLHAKPAFSIPLIEALFPRSA